MGAINHLSLKTEYQKSFVHLKTALCRLRDNGKNVTRTQYGPLFTATFEANLLLIF